MNVKIKLEEEGASMPSRQSAEAAGYDLYLPEHVVVEPGRQVIPLGFRLEMSKNMLATVTPRSGYSAKGMVGYLWPKDVPVAVKDFICGADLNRCRILSVDKTRFDIDVLIGRIDSDYRGIVGVIVKSYEDQPVLLAKGTRIAQMIFSKVETPEIEQTESLSETERGEGGFGHSNEVN